MTIVYAIPTIRRVHLDLRAVQFDLVPPVRPPLALEPREELHVGPGTATLDDVVELIRLN